MPVEEKAESLTDAVTKAIESQDKSDVQIEDKQGEPEHAESDQNNAETPQMDEEAIQGKAIVQILKDPQKAGAFVDFLAKQAGYTKAEVRNAEPDEIKADITKILEKHLGQEFSFLAPKLGPALEEALDTKISSRGTDSDLRARVEKQELKAIEQETASTHLELAQEWFGADDMPDAVVKEMSKAMDEFPPTDPAMTPERYYKRIFALAVGELGIQKSNKSRSDRADRSRADGAARNLNANNRGVAPSSNTGATSRKMSLKDAVSLAMEQVEQSSRK